MSPTVVIAAARPRDALELRRMHRLSMVALAAKHYSRHEIDGLLATVETADPALIASGRYLVGRVGGVIAVSGGHAMRSAPGRGAATLRCIFTHPDYARQGLATALIARLEEEAVAAGARRLEVCATRTGEALCRRLGYRDIGPVEVPLVNGASFPGLRMGKAAASHSLGAVA